MSLERLLADADPALGLPSADPNALRAQAALDAILDGRRAPTATRRRPRTMLLAMAGVAAVVVAATVLAVLPGVGMRTGTAAAATLLRLSGVAAEQPPIVPTSRGQYFYTSYEYPQELSLDSGCAVASCAPSQDRFTVHYVIAEQTWVQRTGATRIEVQRRDPALDPATRAGWIAAGRPSIAHLLPASFTETYRSMSRQSSLALSLRAVEELPVRPDALKAAVDAGPLGGPTYVDQDRFDALATVLTSGGASPSLRASVFRVLASIHGIDDLGLVRDPLGRRGDAFVVAAAERYTCTQSGCPASEMIIDPSTGNLLDEASLSSRGVPTWTSYLALGIADSDHAAPAAAR